MERVSFANRNFTPVFGDRTSFRAKGLHSDKRKSKAQFYFSFWRSSFGAKGLHSDKRKSKSQFYFSFWRSNLISYERVATGSCKSQFYSSFWQSNLISRERVAFGQAQIKFAILPQCLAIELHFVRKGCARTSANQNRNFTSVFADRTSFRAKESIATGSCKSQFYSSFWRSNFISCERVAFRAVSLALPRAFKREIEKKERARGQERM